MTYSQELYIDNNSDIFMYEIRTTICLKTIQPASMNGEGDPYGSMSTQLNDNLWRCWYMIILKKMTKVFLCSHFKFCMNICCSKKITMHPLH